MAAKPVQISIDTALLERIDADAQTKSEGRSAFVRSAIELYLEARKRRQIDQSIRQAFGGASEALLAEVDSLIAGQAWPVE